MRGEYLFVKGQTFLDGGGDDLSCSLERYHCFSFVYVFVLNIKIKYSESEEKTRKTFDLNCSTAKKIKNAFLLLSHLFGTMSPQRTTGMLLPTGLGETNNTPARNGTVYVSSVPYILLYVCMYVKLQTHPKCRTEYILLVER